MKKLHKGILWGLILALPFWLWVYSALAENFCVDNGDTWNSAACSSDCATETSANTCMDIDDLDTSGNWAASDTANKVDANDTVYFSSAGGVHRSTSMSLTVHQSGVSSEPITLTNYPGHTPLIYGSYDFSAGGSWTEESAGEETGGLFASGLEDEVDAFTTDFDGESQEGTNAAAITTTAGQFNSGADGGKLTFDDTNEGNYVYVDIADQTTIYVRAYVKFSSGFAMQGDWEYFMFMGVKDQTNSRELLLATIQCDATAGWQNFRWKLLADNGAVTVGQGSFGEVTLNTWYDVEIMWVQGGAGTGAAEMWIDTVSKFDTTTETWTGTYQADRITVGATDGYLNNADSSGEMYFDDVKADTSAVGAVSLPGANVWYATSALDVGNMIYNSEAIIGVKVENKVDANVQGEYWWDDPNDRVYVYSTSNPGTFYSHIEAAVRPAVNTFINIPGQDYITVSGLTLKYTAYHGIRINGYPAYAPDHIIIENNHLRYIGGAYYSAPLRAGDGIVNYDNGQYIWIRNNRIEEVWDVGIQTEGAEAYVKDYQYIYNNVISNSDFCITNFQNHADATMDHIEIVGNTCYNNGGGWAATHDPGASYRGGIFIWGISGSVDNGIIKNNVVYGYGTGKWSIYFDNLAVAEGGWLVDNNLYYPDSANSFYWNGDDTFADWQTNSGQDANSPTPADPLFTNAGSDDFTLKPGSPARHGAAYLSGYTTRLRPETCASFDPANVTTMEDILGIGACGVYRGAAGM